MVEFEEDAFTISAPIIDMMFFSFRVKLALRNTLFRGGLIALSLLLFCQGISPAQTGNPIRESLSNFHLSHLKAKSQDHWAVALEEIAWVQKDGPVQFESIPQQPSLTALLNLLATATQANDSSPTLVLYRDAEFDNESSRAVATREVVVKLDGGTSPESVASALNATYQGELSYSPGEHRFTLPNAWDAFFAPDILKGHSGVLAVYPQVARWRERMAIPNDPLYPEQWHLKNTGQTDPESSLDLNVEPAWESVRGRGVIIGIVDDGFMANHPDLSANVRSELGYDFRDGDNDPSPFLGLPDQQDPENDPREDRHGTLVAGVAAGRGFNGIGMTGVAPEAGIADIRLIGDYLTDLQEADAINHRHDVIAIKNNSWGPRDTGSSLSGPDRLAQAALFDAVSNGRAGRGSILVWAAGNGGRYDDNANKNGYANSIYTIAVGALGDRGKRARYSEIGPNLLVTAPVGDRRGFGTVTSDLSGDDGLNISGYANEFQDPAYTKNFFGTSSSAPMISGIAALMLEANPVLGWRDVQEIFVRSSRRIDLAADSWFTNAAGFPFSDEYGAGLADAYAAVEMAKSWTNLPPQRTAAQNLPIEAPIDIPDADETPNEYRFSFSGTHLRIEQATLPLFLDHPARGEIAIELESPSGTISQMVGRNDDDSRGYFDWTFSTVQFWGEDADGEWKLRIQDGVSGNTGQLRQATLELHGAETIPHTLPVTPRNLSATGVRSNSIALDWEDVATNETGYRVELTAGWGAPWQIVEDLPANTTHFEIDFVPQGFEIYFRVIALRGSRKSGYSNTAQAYTQDGDGSVILQTGFEPGEGFSVNSGIDGINGWQAFPSGFVYPGQGIMSDSFTILGRPGHGQQAYVGKNWRGGERVSRVLFPTFLDPPPNTIIRATTLVSIMRSTNGSWDSFGFGFFNQDGNFLCNVLFDAITGFILYGSGETPDFNRSSAIFQRNRVHELEMTLDFASNRWSATLGTQTIVSNAPILGSDSTVEANLGGFDAFWHILDTSSPGNNAMLFDDVLITQLGTAAPEMPAEFSARTISESLVFLSWQEDLMAERYEIQRSPDGMSNWMTIANLAEDKSFHIDPYLTSNTVYHYRIRALSSAGNSPFTPATSARTYTEYGGWKDNYRLEVDAPIDEDSDLDNIPLLLEYALSLNPRFDSSSGLPRLRQFEGKTGLRYFRARKELNYIVEGSNDLSNWSSVGIVQEAEILGLFVTAVIESPTQNPYFLRLVVSEKEQ